MGILSLPDQTIPTSEKTEEWHIKHAMGYVENTHTTSNEEIRAQMLKLYRAYNAELSDEEKEMVKSITCPNGHDMGMEFIVYPLIQMKIEQIVGEFMLRPMRRKAYVVDKKSKNKKYEEKLKVLSEKIMRDLTKGMEENLGFMPETENQEVELPDDVEEFFENDFKMLSEQVADGLMTFLLDARKEKMKLKEIFLDYSIVDRCHAVLDKKFGHTTLRKTHPMDCDYDIDPYKVVQDNHEYFFENFWLSENEIYNTFRLTNKQKADVKAQFESMSSFRVADQDSDDLTVSQKYNGWIRNSNKINRIRVVFGMWKSRKTVRIKVSKNKEGRVFYKKLKEEDQERKNDKIEYIDGDEPRYVYMLGPDVCLEWGLMKQRFSFIETPWLCQLPVISLIRDNSTGSSIIKSVAAKLYQLQEVASELLFEIRLAIKHAGDSRVLVYDAAQTPKAFSKGGYENGLNRVMHHVKKDKFLVINSKEKGVAKNTFNQFTSLDLSSKGALQDLFNGLAIIEDLASKFVGISPEREGNVGQYQTATGTDKAVRGSMARTEIIYGPFDDFVQGLLEKMLLKAKQDYEPGEVLHAVFGEMKSNFLKLFDDFFMSDLAMYLSDPRKDRDISEKINAAAEVALTTTSAPEMIMGLIEVFEGENAAEKKAVFKRVVNSLEKIKAENMKAQQQAEQAQAQAEAEKIAKEDEQKAAILQNNIDVANIYANNKAITEGMANKSKELIKAAELSEKRLEKTLENQN